MKGTVQNSKAHVLAHTKILEELHLVCLSPVAQIWISGQVIDEFTGEKNGHRP